MHFSRSEKKYKIITMTVLVLVVFGMTLGFAAFSATLSISSSANISPVSNNFSIKFSTNKDSLVEGYVEPKSVSSGVSASNGIINNSNINPYVSNISASFTSVGQSAEYEFYVRNEGEYTAYLNNISFIGNKTCIGDVDTTESLVQSACDDIIMSVYIDGVAYTDSSSVSNHALATKTGEKISIKVEYSETDDYVDGPFSITFPNVSLVYSTIDDSSIEPKAVRIISGDLNTLGSIVEIGNEKFYGIGNSNGVITLLSMYNLRVGNICRDGSSMFECVGDEMLSPTGIQDSSAIGGRADEDGNMKFPWVGVTAFSKTGNDYNTSIVKTYVDNYKAYLESMGVDVLLARLLTFEELSTLCNVDGDCTGGPEWLYSTSYWTQSPYANGAVYVVTSEGRIEGLACSNSVIVGVRPVIAIPSSEF